MSFNPNIPIATDLLALSQKQMLANYQAIDKAWLTNHVALTAIQDVGKHKTLTLRPVSDPTTLINQSAIYNKLVTSVPQLFFRPNSNATAIQLSNSNLNTLQTGAPGETQVSFLAGPFTIYMGYLSGVGASLVVPLTPATTLIYVGVSTVLPNVNPNNPHRAKQGYNAAVATDVGLANPNEFTLKQTTFLGPTTVYYMAIGI